MSRPEGNGILTTEPVHDLYLSLLLTMVDGGQGVTSMTITLGTPSGVISGDLVSRETWKSLWTETILTKANTSAGTMGLFPDTVDRMLEQVREEVGGHDEAAAEVPRFVHLKDTTLFVPGATPITLPFWRGRLDAVTGWTLGKLGV
ncbi:hypothetical protein AB0D30_07945 [Streptomyces sp. NPDC048409]|uniref:hypothetical protein n=1 Tax=unclassified Streptomyces TaxID=2593676 RepID=UPI003325284E